VNRLPLIILGVALLSTLRADIRPSLDGRQWLSAKVDGQVRYTLKGDNPAAPKEEIRFEKLGFGQTADVRVQEFLGSAVVWLWKGALSSCGEAKDASGLSRICLAIDTGEGVCRLTYILRDKDFSSYSRQKRLGEWSKRFRLQPLVVSAQGETEPETSVAVGEPKESVPSGEGESKIAPPKETKRIADNAPAFLVYRSSKGLFRYHAETGTSEEIAMALLLADKHDYAFFSVAEVDGEKVNVLQRSPLPQNQQISHEKQ
jgi:hypothetical protein